MKPNLHLSFAGLRSAPDSTTNGEHIQTYVTNGTRSCETANNTYIHTTAACNMLTFTV